MNRDEEHQSYVRNRLGSDLPRFGSKIDWQPIEAGLQDGNKYPPTHPPDVPTTFGPRNMAPPLLENHAGEAAYGIWMHMVVCSSQEFFSSLLSVAAASICHG